MVPWNCGGEFGVCLCTSADLKILSTWDMLQRKPFGSKLGLISFEEMAAFHEQIVRRTENGKAMLKLLQACGCEHMVGCLNSGPFWGPHYNTAPSI